MTKRLSAALFCSVALSPMLLAAADEARAQTSPAQIVPPAAPRTAHTRSTPAQSVEDVTVKARNPVHSADGVTGLQPGGGLMKIQVAPKSVSTVSKDYIQKQSPATSPFMLVQLLPGAVVSEVDPWGLSGGSLTLRGLDQTEMAFIWEGTPIADVGVYTTYPSEFADGENLEDLTLQQGSSNIDTPTINGSGGLFTFHDRDPTDTRGGLVDYGYGSYRYNREFVRLDTGLIGNTGIKMFASISHQTDKSWRDSGYDHKLHIDWKAVKAWGDGNSIAIAGAYQDSMQNSYATPNLGQWKELGRSFGFDSTYAYNDTNYWKLNRNPYHNVELSGPMHFVLTDRLSVDFTPYMWHGFGNGTISFDAFNGPNYLGAQLVNLVVPNTVNGAAPELYAFVDDQYRGGFNTETKYRAGHNTFYAGWWFDYSNDHDYYTYSPVNPDGSPFNIWGNKNILRTTDGTPFLGRNDDTKTSIHALYLGDEIKLLHDKLTINAGFKEAIVNRNGTNYLPGPQYKSVLNDAQPLPAISARYQIDVRSQVFASVSTNFRAPVNTTLYNAYSYLDGSVSFKGASNTKDEFSIADEVGYRYSGDVLLASASYFHYNFTNRQIVSAVAGTNGAVTSSQSGGGQTSDGFNLEAGTRPWNHFRPYVALQYLHATIDNDLYEGGDLLPTKGKTAVESPSFVGQAAINWDNGMFFWNLNVRYVTKQYSTFMNDEALPAFYEMGADLGMRFHDFGPAKAPTIQLNLINLTDNHFLSGISSITPNAKNTAGVYGTTIGGDSPAYYIGEGFAAFATFKVGF